MATYFGEKLLALRKQAGKRQRHVVDELNAMFPGIRMSQTTISALEKRQSAPRGDILEKLASYYDVPASYFFESQEAVEARVSRARDYIQSLHTRTYPPAQDTVSQWHERHPAENHNLNIWQPPLESDEYLEN